MEEQARYPISARCSWGFRDWVGCARSDRRRASRVVHREVTATTCLNWIGPFGRPSHDPNRNPAACEGSKHPSEGLWAVVPGLRRLESRIRCLSCKRKFGQPPAAVARQWQRAATLGEIVTPGNAVMKGYYRDPKASADAFRSDWFHSGDAAVVPPDGYV